MKLLEFTRVAWRSLRANKLRSLLTALGMIIGVAAVTALVSVGQGAGATITDQIQAMGAHVIFVRPNPREGGVFTLAEAEEIMERVPTIEAATPSLSFRSPVEYRGTSHDTQIEGVTADYARIREITVAIGRFLNADESSRRTRVAVLGPTVASEVFGTVNPLGETISIRGQPFTVVGVTSSRGAAMGQDQDDVVYIPILAGQRLQGTTRIDVIYARARSADDARSAVAHLTAIYQRRFPRPEAVNIMSQDELLATMGEVTQTLSLLLGAIAGISLLVGGIGIMNIMLVSVSERTREIGIRKALGARRRDIRTQFLLEAVLLSLSGGVLGIGLGWLLSVLVSSLAGWRAVLSPAVILIAFGFAVAVGLFFGVYPARQASLLEPVEALRHD
ncbi:MAG TPA: ABC transporter permease [Bacillota bacterium]|nr:ABC transporter permease [Bacillota bacterium]